MHAIGSICTFSGSCKHARGTRRSVLVRRPAKAGPRSAVRRRIKRNWIPACAGMTIHAVPVARSSFVARRRQAHVRCTTTHPTELVPGRDDHSYGTRRSVLVRRPSEGGPKFGGTTTRQTKLDPGLRRDDRSRGTRCSVLRSSPRRRPAQLRRYDDASNEIGSRPAPGCPFERPGRGVADVTLWPRTWPSRRPSPSPPSTPPRDRATSRARSGGRPASWR
jgi:hypothetical protein